MTDTVLVTGISGYIGAHVAQKLLSLGYAVRGTVRNKVKGQKIVDKLVAGGADPENIELVEADLGADTGWRDAVKDCRYIQHIASPFPLEAPNDREALVPEARAGAQRVLEQGFSAGAERIVMTSSIAAMIGQKNRPKHFKFSENDWTDPDWKAQRSYAVSKTRAEMSAWAYVKAQGFENRLVTVNPGLVLGPDPFENGGASIQVIRSMLKGEFPRVPRMAVPIIDVRDCASIHVKAMTSPEAGGRRLIAAGQTLWFKDIGAILRQEYPDLEKLPSGEIPNFAMKFVALFDDRVKVLLADLGIFNEADAGYTASLTHVIPRSAKEVILATAESLRR